MMYLSIEWKSHKVERTVFHAWCKLAPQCPLAEKERSQNPKAPKEEESKADSCSVIGCLQDLLNTFMEKGYQSTCRNGKQSPREYPHRLQRKHVLCQTMEPQENSLHILSSFRQQKCSCPFVGNCAITITSLLCSQTQRRCFIAPRHQILHPSTFLHSHDSKFRQVWTLENVMRIKAPFFFYPFQIVPILRQFF